MICRSIISSKHASTARAALSPAAPGDSNPSSPAGSASRSAAAMHSAVDRNPGRGCFRMRYALSRRCPDEELESFPAVSPRSSPRSSPFPTPRDDPADGPSFGMDSPYCTLDVFSPSTYAGSSRTHGILLYIRLARCHVVSMTTRCLGGAPPASDPDRSPSPGTPAPSSFDVVRRSVAASGAGHSTPTSLFGRCLGLGTTSGTEVSNQTLVQSSSANSATMALPKGLFSASILSCSTVMPSLLSMGESPTMDRTTSHAHSLWTLLHRQHISLPFGASESSASSASSPLEARGASGKGVSNPSFASFGRGVPSPVIPGDPEAEAVTVSHDARPPLAPATTVLSAAARTAELLDAIRSLHALAWSLDMPRALLPGDALVDTPTAALAICGPALLHMFTKETRFG